MAEAACNICAIFEAYQEHAETTLETVVKAIHGPFLGLVTVMIGGWVVWTGIKVLLGRFELGEALRQAIFLVLGFGVYMALASGELVKTVFTNTVNMMGGLASLTLDAQSVGYSGMDALLKAIEEVISQIWNIATALIGSGGSGFWASVTGIGATILGIVFALGLLVPYLVLLVLFLSHTAVALFRVTLVLGMSPFVVGMASFPFGRDLAGSATRTLTAAIVTMVSMAMVFALVKESIGAIGITATGENIEVGEWLDLASGKYLLALIMGWLGVALISEAASLAGQLTGVLYNGASAGTLSKSALRPAARGAGAVGSFAGGMAARGAGVAGRKALGAAASAGRALSAKAGGIIRSSDPS